MPAFQINPSACGSLVTLKRVATMLGVRAITDREPYVLPRKVLSEPTVIRRDTLFLGRSSGLWASTTPQSQQKAAPVHVEYTKPVAGRTERQPRTSNTDPSISAAGARP